MRRVLLVLGFLLLAHSASAQVQFDAQGTADCPNPGATSVSWNTSNGGGCAANTPTFAVGVSGTNRALVCAVSWSGAVTSPTMTWGGTSMTLITGATVTNTQQTNIYGLVAPATGSQTLAVSWTNSVSSYIDCVSFTNVDQTGGATSFPNGTSATGTGTSSSLSVTSGANDYIVAVACNATNVTAVNNSSIYIDTAQVHDCGANKVAGATATMTTTIGSSAAWGAAGTSVKAAGGGGCTAPPGTLMLLGVGNCKGDEELHGTR